MLHEHTEKLNSLNVREDKRAYAYFWGFPQQGMFYAGATRTLKLLMGLQQHCVGWCALQGLGVSTVEMKVPTPLFQATQVDNYNICKSRYIPPSPCFYTAVSHWFVIIYALYPYLHVQILSPNLYPPTHTHTHTAHWLGSSTPCI